MKLSQHEIESINRLLEFNKTLRPSEDNAINLGYLTGLVSLVAYTLKRLLSKQGTAAGIEATADH